MTYAFPRSRYIASVADLNLGLFALDYPLMDDRLWDNLGNFSQFVSRQQKTDDAAAQTFIHVAVGTPLRQAQAQARAAAVTAAQMGGGREVIIQLAGGTHTLTDGPIVLTNEDSGIEWRGAQDAVISGGINLPLASFESVPATDPVLARLPAGHKTLRADISAYRSAFGLPGCRMSSGGPMELHTLDGTALTAARWPNLQDNTVIDGWATATAAPSATSFRFNASTTYRQPQNSTGTTAHGYWSIDYLDSSVEIESLSESGVATLYTNKTVVKPPARFFLLNQPEFVDSPGEWWIDQEMAMLYLLPPTTPVPSPANAYATN